MSSPTAATGVLALTIDIASFPAPVTGDAELNATAASPAMVELTRVGSDRIEFDRSELVRLLAQCLGDLG